MKKAKTNQLEILQTLQTLGQHTELQQGRFPESLDEFKIQIEKFEIWIHTRGDHCTSGVR